MPDFDAAAIDDTANNVPATFTAIVRKAVTVRKQGANFANDAERLASLVSWAQDSNLVVDDTFARAMLASHLREYFVKAIPMAPRIGEFWRSFITHAIDQVDWDAIAAELYAVQRPSPPSPDPAIPHEAESVLAGAE